MIPHALSGLTFIERFYSYPVVASTNDTARSLSQRPKKGLYCIQADQQSAGRGRRGTSFFSDSIGGLWASVVIPMDNIGNHFVHNRALSLAIVLTLEQCGKNLPLTIKWPNDIFWGEKKICGILLENHPKFSDVLIAGFGINVNISRSEFPVELQQIATSVLMETGQKCSLSALLRTILKQYTLCIAADQEKTHTFYVERLYGRGRIIGINGLKGIFTSVAPDGRLKLVNKGIPVLVHSGSPVFMTSTKPEQSNARKLRKRVVDVATAKKQA
jgi:biotin-[acetyl-CoA-carboxylase] ligase BirA-like protein